MLEVNSLPVRLVMGTLKGRACGHKFGQNICYRWAKQSQSRSEAASVHGFLLGLTHMLLHAGIERQGQGNHSG